MEKYKVFSNINKSLKWRGLVDYKTLIFLCIYLLVIWNGLDLFNVELNIRIYLSLLFFIPPFLLIVSNTGEDDILDIIYITIKYVLSNKIYVMDIVEENSLKLVRVNNEY